MNHNSNCIFSADCDTVDAGLKVEIDESKLPVQHGADLEYSCPEKSDILDGIVKAVCEDGKISLSPATVSPCRKTSTQ